MKPYLVLLRVEFTLQLLLPVIRCALTAPFQPYLWSSWEQPSAVFSLLHLSSAYAAQALPGTLFIGARTFLPPIRISSVCTSDTTIKQRLSGQLSAHFTWITKKRQGLLAQHLKIVGALATIVKTRLFGTFEELFISTKALFRIKRFS